MAEVAKGIIDIEINTGSAASQLQALQSQINAFNLALNKSNKAQGTFASEYSRELQSAINKTGLFTAETIRLQTAAATLDKTLSKGKTSLGQFFSAKFNKDSAIAAETMALASERARRLQTQFIATSGAANGFQDALAVRPLSAFSSEVSVAAQRTQILSNMFKQGTTQLINFGKNVQWAGRQLMVGFTVPLTIFGAIAGKTFMDLEKQVVGFKKVYGDMFTTPAELNQNLEAVKGLASEYTKYGIAVKDTIGLAAQAAAAGRQNSDLTDAVAQSTRLATLGQMDQNDALETTISLQSAFKLSGQDLADTINFLNMVENQTVVSLQDIAAAIPRVAPVISGLGGDVKDLTVFLAAMQEGGVQAAEGANALKSGLASLINPTRQATDMLSGMGINLQAIVETNKGDLMGTVQSFSQALASLDQFSRQQALEQVFGKFQYAKLGALFENISREGSQAQQVIATLGYTTEQLASTADKELKTIEESFGVQLTGAVERFKLAIAPIGELFVRLAIPIVNFATKIAESFNSLSDGQKRFAAIAAVIVGVVIPAVTMMAGLFLNLVGTLAKIGQGMALFGKGFITGGPIGAIKALTQSSKYLSLAEMDAAMAAQQLSGSSAILNKTLVEQAITGNAAAAAINNLARAYSAMAATQGAAGSLPSFGVAAAAGNAAKTSQISVRTLRRNAGGGVPGSGNTDTVPAMLTPGEFVINKEATKKNLGLLQAINNGIIQKFSQGGSVLDEIAAIRAIGFGATGRDRSPSSIRRSPIRKSSSVGGMFSDVASAIMMARIGKRGAAGGFRRVNTRGKSSSGRVAGPSNTSYSGAPGQAGYKPYSQSRIEDIIDSSFDQYGGVKARNELSTGLKKQEGQKSSSLVFGHAITPEFLSLTEAIGAQTGRRGSYPRANVSQLQGNLFGTSKRDADSNALLDILPSTGAIIPQSFNTSLGRGTATAQQFGKSTWYNELELIEFLKQQGVPSKDIVRAAERSAEFKNRFFANYGGNVDEKLWGRIQNAAEKQAILQLNSGGTVPGAGNTDTVPAMLTPGEFVVNKKAASQNQGILEMMNGGQVKGYKLGGLVSAAGTVAQMGGMIGGNMPLMIAGTVVQMLGPLLGKVAGKGGVDGGASGISGSIKNIGPALKNISIAGRTLSLGMVSMAGGVALAGFAIYKLNKSLNDAQKSGAKLSDAMYGSAEKTKAMGEAFGRESRADTSRRLAVEKAGGQEITQEAQAASGEFMKSDAASQMIKDLELVKKSGEDVALSLRNQLASSIVAGVISPEEAKAIAIDMGKELNDQKLAVNVSGQLSSLLGPNGEKLLTDPAGIVVAISPEINKDKIKNDAQDAYNALNPLQEFGQLFKGGKEQFVKNFSIETISSQNASALAKEAEARAMLNAQVQEGTITLEQYIKAVSGLGEASKASQSAVADANAQALGFSDVAGMNAAANRMSDRQKQLDTNTGANGQTLTPEQRNQLLTEGSQDTAGQQALESANKVKEQLRTILKDSGYEDAAAQSIITGVENGLADGRVGDAAGLFAKVISGELRAEDVDMVARLKLEGDLDQAGLDDLIAKIDILRTVPEIETKFNFNSVNTGEDINEIMSLYDQLQKNPDITKKMFAEDKFTSVFKQFGIDYNMIAALPDLEQAIVTKNIQTYVEYRAIIEKDRKTDPSEVARDLRILDSTVGANIKNTFTAKTGADKTQDFSGLGGNSGSGGGGDDKLKRLKDMLMERFRLQEMLIDKEAEGFNKRIKQISREIQLQQRQIDLEEKQVELRQKALEELSKKEDEVNTVYDNRTSALDRVSSSNSRLASQEQSRISLASALASGDIAGAASAMSNITQQSAETQIEDTRTALELQREEALKNLTVNVNGTLMTRKDIEASIETIQANIALIQTSIYDKNILIQTEEDKLLKIEEKRLKVAENREKVETRMYLLEQKKDYDELNKKSRRKKLSSAEKAALGEYKTSYNNMATFYNQQNPDTPVQLLNRGGMVSGMGMRDTVPARLTPGEFVVKKNATKTFLPLLESINSGVFPSVGGMGLSSPKYNVPANNITNVSVSQSISNSSNASTMYNNSYSINVNVSGSNSSADEIANVVMGKIARSNSGSIRGSRY